MKPAQKPNSAAGATSSAATNSAAPSPLSASLPSRWFQPSLSRILFIGLLMGIGVLAFIASRLIETALKEKALDAAAILFLEQERLAMDVLSTLKQGGTGESVYTLDQSGKSSVLTRVSGKGPAQLKAKDLGLERILDIRMEGLHLVRLGGLPYRIALADTKAVPAVLAVAAPSTEKTSRKNYVLNEIDPARFEKIAGAKAFRFYIGSTSGQLIHSNSNKITPKSFPASPLVQAFIASPGTNGQITLDSADGGKAFGFFQEIKGSNLVAFSEISREAVLKNYQGVKQRAWMLIGASALLLGILFFILHALFHSDISGLQNLISGWAGGEFNPMRSRARMREFSQMQAQVSELNERLPAIVRRQSLAASRYEAQKIAKGIESANRRYCAWLAQLSSLPSTSNSARIPGILHFCIAQQAVAATFYHVFSEAEGSVAILGAFHSTHGRLADPYLAGSAVERARSYFERNGSKAEGLHDLLAAEAAEHDLRLSLARMTIQENQLDIEFKGDGFAVLLKEKDGSWKRAEAQLDTDAQPAAFRSLKFESPSATLALCIRLDAEEGREVEAAAPIQTTLFGKEDAAEAKRSIAEISAVLDQNGDLAAQVAGLVLKWV